MTQWMVQTHALNRFCWCEFNVTVLLPDTMSTSTCQNYKLLEKMILCWVSWTPKRLQSGLGFLIPPIFHHFSGDTGDPARDFWAAEERHTTWARQAGICNRCSSRRPCWTPATSGRIWNTIIHQNARSNITWQGIHLRVRNAENLLGIFVCSCRVSSTHTHSRFLKFSILGVCPCREIAC